MLIKTKHIINYCLALSIILFVCSCNKSKVKTPPLAPDYKPFYPPSYGDDNDQYYVPPIINHNDRFDDNRDRIYR